MGATHQCVIKQTGSYQFWLKDSACTSQPACVDRPKFNSGSSTSFQDLNEPAKEIRYVDGSNLLGRYVRDSVDVGGLSVPSFRFQLGSTVNDNATIDGVMGLSLPPDSIEKTFWDAVRESGNASSSVISYFISSSARTGGITLGGVDLARFSGELAWVPVPTITTDSPYFWRMRFESVQVAGTAFVLPANTTIVADTGSSVVIFPADLAYEINKQLGLEELGSGFYGRRCPDGKIPADMKTLRLNFGRVSLRFTANEYLFVMSNENGIYCFSGITSPPLGDSRNLNTPIIIGNVLLQRYYTVFGKRFLSS